MIEVQMKLMLEHKTCLAMGVLTFWNQYLISLRPVEGLPPANLKFQDSSHEIVVCAQDPRKQALIGDQATWMGLQPPNIVYQVRTMTDEQAIMMFRQVLESYRNGLNPDTDFRSAQMDRLEELERRVKGAK